ncbi:hypothetical protein Stube_35100 [Streptomyces tubercidicus]|uniref:Uncharacterized protein n=1 Tax=Streptomyces tubercidicus TaxID=47759 RepID=A0A640UTD8_9ACTN|nr:hypothetical protein Stube_35100 [Streptomyces tubercidicus]
MRLRRLRGLTCYWHQGDFVAHAYQGHAPVALHPSTAEILSAFDTWTTLAEAAESLDQLHPETVMKAAGTLLDCGLLTEERSPEAEADKRLADTWAPGHRKHPSSTTPHHGPPYVAEHASARPTEDSTRGLGAVRAARLSRGRRETPAPVLTCEPSTYHRHRGGAVHFPVSVLPTGVVPNSSPVSLSRAVPRPSTTGDSP